MASRDVTTEDLAIIDKLQEATGLEVDRSRIRISNGGNICVRGAWQGELVLDSTDGSLVSLPPRKTLPDMPQLANWPRHNPTYYARTSGTRPRAARTPPTPRQPSPAELYWAEHGDGIPDEVMEILCKDVAKGKPFKTWQRELIASAKTTQSENGRSVTVKFDTRGKSRALVSLCPVKAGRPTGWARREVSSFADEAKAIEKNLGKIGYKMTAVGQKKVCAACKREARRTGREILSSSGLDRKTHRLPNDGFDDKGRGILDGLLEGEPRIDLGNVADHYSRRTPKTQDHWNPTFILCRVGEARLYYDIRDGSVTLSEGDSERVMRYADAKRFAKEHGRLCEEVDRAFTSIAGHDDIRIGPVDDGKASVTVNTLEEHKFHVMLDRPAKPQVAEIIKRVRTADSETREEWRERCEETGLVGDLLAMEIMGFLVANHDIDSGNYITAGVLEKEFKNRQINIWSGVSMTWLSGRLSAMTVGEHKQRLDALRRHGLVHGVWRKWKNHGYNDEFQNLRATMPVGKVFMELSEEEPEDGVPAETLTEMQLLHAMREGVDGKTTERLAEELPALLDHPACVLADTDAMARYVIACPQQLRDYLPLAYKLSHDRTQRKAMRVLNERIAELEAEPSIAAEAEDSN